MYGVILVELIEEGSFGDYISRKFKLTHTEVCQSVIEKAQTCTAYMEILFFKLPT